MAAESARLFPVDVVRRGLMAHHHARDLIAQADLPSELWSRLARLSADPVLFLTRCVTHLCAPGFFQFMGVGRALFAARRVAALLTVFGGSALLFYLVHLYHYALTRWVFAAQRTGRVAIYRVWLLGAVVCGRWLRWPGVC